MHEARRSTKVPEPGLGVATPCTRVRLRNGDVQWSCDGLLHCPDGPAVVRGDGSTAWYDHGLLHRDDGPAVVTAAGDRTWYDHGRVHRGDGPATVTADGDMEWFRYGRRHRLDGPAVVHACGRSEHWVDGRMAHTREGWLLLSAAFLAGDASPGAPGHVPVSSGPSRVMPAAAGWAA